MHDLQATPHPDPIAFIFCDDRPSLHALNSEPKRLLTFANAVCLPALTAIRFNIPNILR